MDNSLDQDIGQRPSDMIQYVSLEFQWNNNPRWYKTELSHAEYAQTMSKGMIDGKPISAVSLWYEGEYCLVYSFKEAGSGNNPWKIERT